MLYQTPTSIALRCYTEKPCQKAVGSRVNVPVLNKPSSWSVIFDCETTVDAAQRLKVGSFQVRKGGKMEQEGLFIDEDALTDSELATIAAYADQHGLSLLTRGEFASDVFLKYGYRLNGEIIGFNLPFDISRITIGHGPARGSMRGGFSFKLTKDKRDPKVRVKHLSRKAALIDFARPGKQQTPRGMRKRGLQVQPHRGHFLDVKTLAAALTSQGGSLASLCKRLGTPTQKHETDDHGQEITPEYLDYARADVQATWECAEALYQRFEPHGLEQVPHKILSEASLGKGYLKKMGIDPLLACQPGFDRGMFGKLMSAYCGGRAEVRIRRVPTEVIYADFKSMYPTVNSLMGFSEFLIADGMTWHDTTGDTQAWLNTVTTDDLLKPETWRQFRTIVRLKPDQDVLPVRAKYDGKSNTIGLNTLTTEFEMWITLADAVASKLQTGKAPVLEEAITFEPGPPQEGLRPIKLFGRDEFEVDPLKDDVFKRLVDLRDEAKANGDPIEQAIKIIANATCYGIFIEIIRDDAPKPELIHVFGPNGEQVDHLSKAIEEPGKYYNPFLGVMITGAARLMLTMSERLTIDAGLSWVFCDTDSLAMARPDGMARQTFRTKALEVVEAFGGLNPYQAEGSILQLEKHNFALDGSDKFKPLFAYAISAKRYALFNINADGKPVLRKASAHGLGQLLDPYTDAEATETCPIPLVPLSEIGVSRCQHDLWFKIIEAALSGNPDRVNLNWHPSLKNPAISRYAATTPEMLKWMDSFNADKPYEEQVRPFGFMVSLQAKSGLLLNNAEPILEDPGKMGKPGSKKPPKPIAPFSKDPAITAANAVDRETGQPVCPTQLKTHAESLAQFHISPEPKFENGGFCDRGVTLRRSVLAVEFDLIGKESNKVGESGEAHPAEPETLTIKYGAKK